MVVPRIAPLTEIAVDGETGYCVEPESPEALAEAIVRLLTQLKEAGQMGQGGVQRVYEMFSVDRTACQIVEVYTRIGGS